MVMEPATHLCQLVRKLECNKTLLVDALKLLSTLTESCQEEVERLKNTPRLTSRLWQITYELRAAKPRVMSRRLPPACESRVEYFSTPPLPTDRILIPVNMWRFCRWFYLVNWILSLCIPSDKFKSRWFYLANWILSLCKNQPVFCFRHKKHFVGDFI